MISALPGKVTVNVSQDLHEVRVDRGEANTGCLPHVDGALLRQVHVVEVDELKLGLLLWPEWTQNQRFQFGESFMSGGNTIFMTDASCYCVLKLTLDPCSLYRRCPAKEFRSPSHSVNIHC